MFRSHRKRRRRGVEELWMNPFRLSTLPTEPCQRGNIVHYHRTTILRCPAIQPSRVAEPHRCHFHLNAADHHTHQISSVPITPYCTKRNVPCSNGHSDRWHESHCGGGKEDKRENGLHGCFVVVFWMAVGGGREGERLCASASHVTKYIFVTHYM